MKLLQLCLSVVMLILSVVMTIVQTVMTSSIIVAGAFALIAVLMSFLVGLSWAEFKAQFNQED